MLCLRMGSDSPNAEFSTALLEDFMIVPLISLSGKNWLQIPLLFISSYFLQSGCFISPPCLLSACFSGFFQRVFFCIFRSLSFPHITYVPVLSSFKDVFFEFHDLVIVLFSIIKFTVLGFDLSTFCGSVTWSLCTVPTDLSCCYFMP